jgi:hypothetical protein
MRFLTRQFVQHSKVYYDPFLHVFPTGVFGVLRHGYTDNTGGVLGNFGPSDVAHFGGHVWLVLPPRLTLSGSYPFIPLGLYVEGAQSLYVPVDRKINKALPIFSPVSIYFTQSVYICCSSTSPSGPTSWQRLHNTNH